MRVAACLLAAAAAVGAQDPERTFGEFLERTRAYMGRQPNYTCLETIERTSETPGGGPQVQDTLRIEVALVDNKEMFAWPGSREFEDARPTELVSTGMFGNGNFALYFRILFGGGGPRFEHRGEERIGERAAARYDFQVPRRSSRFQITLDKRSAYVGYHGSVFVDPETLDLRRLHMVADDIPETLGLTAAEDRVDYEQVEIGEEPFLLPVESLLMMASPGVVNHNRVRFTGCRKFTGESELVFVDPELLEAERAPVPVREVQLPAGARLELVVMTRIDFEEGYVGQAVAARLNRDVKMDGDVVAPKGAIARGRVTQLQRWRNTYVVAIDWSDLDWPGGHAPLDLVFDGIVALPQEPVYSDAAGALVIRRPGRRSFDNVIMFWRAVE